MGDLGEQKKLEEEQRAWEEEQSAESREQKRRAMEEQKQRAEEEDRDNLKKTWLDMLFTSKSVAAMNANSEGALPVSFTAGSRLRPTSVLVWVGDDPESDKSLFKDLGKWSQHEGHLSRVAGSYSWRGAAPA